MKFNLKGGTGVNIQRIAAVSAGMVAGRAVNKILNDTDSLAKINPLLVGAGKIVLGVVLGMKSKSATIKDVGFGIAAAGGLDLAEKFFDADSKNFVKISGTGAGWNLPSSQMYLNGVGSRYSNMEERHVVAGPESQYTIDNDTAVAGIM